MCIHEYCCVGADKKVNSLLKDLDEAIGLLEQAGEVRWRTWLAEGRAEIAARDAHGLDRLLGAFGGMGSFNDLVLRQPNSTSSADFLSQADHRLWELRDSIWHACRDLKHDLS